MSLTPPHWYESIKKVIKLLALKEVKTPLSFFFRVITATVLIVAAGIWLLDPAGRLKVLLGAGGLLAFLVVIVALLAWFKPRNLVYGETGYRAETRLTLGTEKEQIGEVELASLPRESNPNSLELAKKEAEAQ